MYNKIISEIGAYEFQEALDKFMKDLDEWYYPKTAIFTVVNSTGSIASDDHATRTLYFCHIMYLSPEKHYPANKFDNNKKPY